MSKAKKSAAKKPAAKKSAKGTKSESSEKIANVVYRINALLHTMRAIERHEEQLCVVMTEIKNSGKMTPVLDDELRDLLEQMPAHEYKDDIDDVREALGPGLLAEE